MGLRLLSSGNYPLPGKNHDGYAYSDRAWSVVDGATPLRPDSPQDVGDFARAAADLLVSLADQPEPWRDTISALRGQFTPAGHERTAAAGLMRHDNRTFRVELLGDVMALVLTDDGSVHRLTDEHFVSIDTQTAASDDFATARVQLRELANTPGGYPILADDSAAAEALTTRSWPLAQVRVAWLMSDGAWRVLPDNPSRALAALMDGFGPRGAFADDATWVGVSTR